MAHESPEYWQLISVLFSSFPLSPAVAMCLHQAAFELYRTGGSVAPVAGDLLSGEVHNLKKDALVGTIGGPVFEAQVETERGSGTVRFLLTRSGLELMNAQPAKPQYLN